MTIENVFASFEDAKAMIENLEAVKSGNFVHATQMNVMLTQIDRLSTHMMKCQNIACQQASAKAISMLNTVAGNVYLRLARKHLSDAEIEESDQFVNTILKRVTPGPQTP